MFKKSKNYWYSIIISGGGKMGCTKCGGETEGWKCDICGSLAEEHVDNHECGGEHCIPKCKDCQEAESKCTCSSSESMETSKESEWNQSNFIRESNEEKEGLRIVFSPSFS